MRADEFNTTNRRILNDWDLWRAPSRLKLSDWADQYRILSSESSASPGRWSTAAAPYEREIMDAISDLFTPKIVVQKASQLGITDSAVLNPIGYFMDQDPCPIMVVQPTIELAEAFSTDRLQPMLRDTPRLHGLVADPRARDSTNTLRRKSFKGGFVAIGGANSPASLSGRPVRVLLLDDVDRYPASAGAEGNPIQLASSRTSAFWNRKIVVISSPAIKGVSHVEREMSMSTQEHWYLPCPSCGFMQILAWDRIRFSDLEHTCLQCNAGARKWRWLKGTGEWRKHRPFDDRGNPVTTRGFYLSGLINPWIEWDIFIVEFMAAVRANEDGDVEPLKAFRNTRLGELFEERGDRVDVDLYGRRREVYRSEIPDGVLVLTAGVDVGERMINYEIVGWGKGRESWGIEYGILDGDPREDDVWALLDRALYHRIFTTSDGKKMRVRRIAVDSGYASDFVYHYTKARQPRAIAIRGEGGLGKPFIKGAGVLTKTNRARLMTLGVDAGKEEIVNRLRVDRIGAGYCHFPKLSNGQPIAGYDEEYFKGLCAERRVAKAKQGFRTYIWAKLLSQRNEPFDCRNYALGALAMPSSGINLEQMRRDEFEARDAAADQAAVPFGPQGTGTAGRPSKGFGAQNRPIE